MKNLYTVKIPAKLIAVINWHGIELQNKSEVWNWEYSLVKLDLSGDWRLLLRVSAECDDRAFSRGCYPHCQDTVAALLYTLSQRIEKIIGIRATKTYRETYVRTQANVKETQNENI